MSQTKINKNHVVLQFSRRINELNHAQFLYGEVAQRMLGHLSSMKINVDKLLDAGCGLGHSFYLLNKLYSNSYYIGLDISEPILKMAQSLITEKNFFRKFFCLEKFKFILADLSKTGLKSNSISLIWSNMSLHWHPSPNNVFLEWNRILKKNGLVIFSCFGPNTLKEIKQATVASHIKTEILSFVDMHDLGDLLALNKFYGPVMQSEVLTITYTNREALFKDLYSLGGNPIQDRRTGLISMKSIDLLFNSLKEICSTDDGLVKITVEIIYGHAWKTDNFTEKKIIFHKPNYPKLV